MTNPNSHHFQDDTFQSDQPETPPPPAPAQPAPSEPEPEPLDQTMVEQAPRSVAKPAVVPDALDQTFVSVEQKPAKPTVVPRVQEAFDQTLVHETPSQRPAVETRASPILGTPLKPTLIPHRDDTHTPPEDDHTLVHSPAPAPAPTRAPDHTAQLDDGTLVNPVTAAPHQQDRTEGMTEQKQGRPTGGANATDVLPSGKSAKVPSFKSGGDRYEVTGTLGRGGMGVVYKARDKQLNRFVALKMILSGAHAAPETLMRFRIEAEAVAKLQHPNIVQIFDIGERDGHPYFSLEYLDGGSLHQKLDGAPQQPKQAAVIVETLARAIHYAHLRGIVHRDMKPANVLLDADGLLKITDFGLAKQLDVEDSGQTGTEAILGTPTYMAPEQAAGRTKDVGPAADIYALGAMLYEMLTGHPPFRGTTVMETLQQVQYVEPVQPRRLQPNAPLDLQTICLKCLNKEPQKRYVSAEALADDLRAYLDDRPIAARPTPFTERVAKWVRRQPMQAALVAVSFVAACGLVYGVVHHVLQQNELRESAERTAAFATTAKETEEKRREEAEAAAVTIKNERDAKEVQRQLAVMNEVEAKTNAERARANFKQAKAAVDQLTNLAQQSLVDKPGLEKVRDDLLNRVVLFYEEFIKANKDESLTLEKGQAYQRLGDVQQMLGKNSEAAVSYGQATEGYATLLTADAKEEAARRSLATTSLSNWAVLRDLGKQAPAAQALEQAQTVLTQLHADFPNQPDYLRDLAKCQNNFGIVDFSAGKLDAANEHYQTALKHLNQVKDADNRRPSYQLERARTYNNLGMLHTQRAAAADLPETDRSKAADYFAQAMKVLKPLVERFPETAIYAKELGSVYTDLAVLLKSRPTPADALAIYNEAIQLFGTLSTKYEGVTDYRHLLALNRANRGTLLGQQKDYAAARTDLEAAGTTLGQLATSFPKRPVYRLDQARTDNALGYVLEAEKQPEPARQAWERAKALLAPLVKEYPDQDSYRQELERTAAFLLLSYQRDAKTLGEAGRWPEAAATTAQLVDLREQLATSVPTEANKSELASTRLALIEMCLAARNYDEAEKALSAFSKQKKDVPLKWGKLHLVAAAAYRSLEQADRASTLSPESRARLRESRTEECLLLLRDAIDRHETIVLGPNDFKSLRENPDFKEMLTEIERNQKKTNMP